MPTDDCPVHGGVSAAALWRVTTAGRAVAVRRGAAALRLRAAGGGRLAIEPSTTFSPPRGPGTGLARGSGEVRVLDATGRQLATVPALPGDEPRAVVLARALVLQRRTTLELRSLATGALVRTIPLGDAARLTLVGASSRLALLTARHRLVVVRLSDGARRDVPFPQAVRACACPVAPRLGDAGLAYGYNLRSGAERGRVVFVPHAGLLARFG